MKNKLVLLSFLITAAANAYQNDTTALDGRYLVARLYRGAAESDHRYLS